jgi:plastocyanin
LRTLTFAYVAALIVLAAATDAASLLAEARAQGTIEVEGGNNWFCDPSFELDVCETVVSAGDTVLWAIVEGVHTVTQCNSSFAVCPPAGGYDSGILNVGGSFAYTFTEPGRVYYYCALHPVEMRGVVTVLAAETPPAAPMASPSPPVEESRSPGPDSATPAITPASVPATGGPPAGGDAQTILAFAAAATIGVLAGAVGLRRLAR